MMNGEDPGPGDEGRTDQAADDDVDRQGTFFSRLRGLFGDASGEDASYAANENGAPDAGVISEARRAMIERVVAFDEKTVVDVMAPRADIAAVEINTPLDELVRLFADAGHSRLPIYRGDLDDPVGMVHIKDVIGLLSNGARDRVEEPVLKTIRREVLYAPPSMKVTDLLLRMQASRIHLALVVDEYGGTDGLVTIEDLVEEIVGEINDEHDEADDAAIVPAPEGGWDVDARVELDIFAEETGYRLETEDDEIDTVGGFVVSLAGRVPQRGEVIDGEGGFEYEVIEADARKVRRLRIRPRAERRGEAAE